MTPLPPAAGLARRTPRAHLRASLSLGAWGLAIAFGFHAALTYQATPGAPVEARAVWPRGLSVELDPQHPTLVLALHSHCPCSRATLAELDRLLPQLQGAVRIHAFFYSDPTLGAHWHETDLWRHAASIPGVEVHADELGRNARVLGAQVSGTAFLYSTDGRLLFEGGLTAGRGHEGENPGADAIAAILAGRTPATRSAPAYGCALFEAPSSPLEP